MRVLKNSATDRWRHGKIPLTSTVLFLPKAPVIRASLTVFLSKARPDLFVKSPFPLVVVAVRHGVELVWIMS